MIKKLKMEDIMLEHEENQKNFNAPLPTQYLMVIKDLTFKDYGGRRTCISDGDIGYALDKEQISLIPNASSKQKSKMIDELKDCHGKGWIYALVCGYPCKLMPDECLWLDDEPFRCCGELI